MSFISQTIDYSLIISDSNFLLITQSTTHFQHIQFMFINRKNIFAIVRLAVKLIKSKGIMPEITNEILNSIFKEKRGNVLFSINLDMSNRQ